MSPDEDEDTDVAASAPLLVPELYELLADSIRSGGVSKEPARRKGPRRVFALSLSGVAAITAIVLVLALGGPSNSGPLSPQRAVAAASDALDGARVLHWVRQTKVTGPTPDGVPPGAVLEEQWVDLSTGDSYTSKTSQAPARGMSAGGQSWVEKGQLWLPLPTRADGRVTIRRLPGSQGGSRPGAAFAPIENVEDVRTTLQRAERGEAEIGDGGSEDGVPLVVITDRAESVERRTLLTREDDPRVLRTTTVVQSGRSSTPITTSTVTQTWELLDRSEAALKRVAIPETVERAP